MSIVWLCLLTYLAVAWVVLDGYVFGTGILLLGVARTEGERIQVLETVLPLWDGDQVFLVALAAASIFTFPGLYASGFSGFYLPLIILLWLFMMRGFSLALRDYVQHQFWQTFWNACLLISSVTATFFFGVAVANILRGVPLGKDGYFFLALWTNLRLGAVPGILDWYTATTGVAVVVAVMLHGAAWIAFRTDGLTRQRALKIGLRLWPAVALLTIVESTLTFAVQPRVPANFARYPWGVIFPMIAIAALAAAAIFLWNDLERAALAATSLYLAGMLSSVAFGLYPYLLPAYKAAGGLSIYNTASESYAQWIALAWFIPGMVLVTGYTTHAHLKNMHKVQLHKVEPLPP